jgi:hypothetical protein
LGRGAARRRVAVCLNTRCTRDDLAYYGRHAAISGAITGPAYANDVAAAMTGLDWLTDDLTDLLGDAADLRQ